MSQHLPSHEPCNLHSLSTELKLLICSALGERNWDGSPDPRGQLALLNLSSTSRFFRDNAQHLAYRTLVYPSVNLAGLVRTLYRRPDLAACVREFYQPSHTFYRNEREERNYLVTTVENFELYDYRSPTLELFNFHPIILDDIGTEIIIILTARRLQSLRLLIQEDDSLRENQYQFLSKFVQPIWVSLQVDPLKFNNLVYLEFGRKTSTHMPFQVPPISVLPLLSAAHHLRFLVFRGISNLNDDTNGQEMFGQRCPTLPHLQMIDMKNCALERNNWGEPFLSQLAAKAPNLSLFKYNTEQFPHFDPITKHLPVPHMLRAIKGQQDSISNLRCLSIHLDAFARCKWPNRGNLVGRLDFDAFPHLETLGLDENAICRCYEMPLSLDTSKAEANCLVEVIPTQIKNLVLRVFKGLESHTWEDLDTLALMLGRFPNLVSIVVEVKVRLGVNTDRAQFEKRIHTRTKACQELIQRNGMKFCVEFY